MTRENILSYECQVNEEIGLLNLAGELVAESRFEPERILREWLDEGRHRIIVTCGGLNYIDSAGLSTLLGALHRFRRQGGDLILADMNPSLNAIFEVTSMEKYFKIFPTVDAARSHFDEMSAQRRKTAGRPAAAKKDAAK